MCKCKKEPVKIKFARTTETAKIPTKKLENAGYDIYADFEDEYVIIKPHQTVMIPTNIASVIPNTHYFQLFERGSTGTKGIAQRCGVIDSGFRNTWFVPITNTNDVDMIIYKESYTDIIFFEGVRYPYSKAICQAVLLPVPQVEIEEITMDELLSNKSERGIGMLGSSNK